MPLFGPTEPATFLARPNRFVVECRLGRRRIRAFLPNPGRMRELLLPGVELRLERSDDPRRRLPHTVVAVRRHGGLIGLDTLRANRMVRGLLEARRVPGLEACRVVRSEVRHGASRFDFLLEGPEGELLLEVKSSTLAGRRLAMFPDAATERGRRHLEELAAMDRAAGALFMVQSPTAEAFLPDVHSDLEFARTMLRVRDRVRFLPVATSLDEALEPGPVRPLALPWEVAERDCDDRGCYLLLLHRPCEEVLEVGRLGWLRFPSGFYVYAGSARGGLKARLDRHRRGGRVLHWHVDHLRRAARFVEALPIRTGLDLECEVASALAAVADGSVPGFGCSDCRCPSHLFRFATDPRGLPAFADLLLYFRTDRLLEPAARRS